jgi:hypothetical protein
MARDPIARPIRKRPACSKEWPKDGPPLAWKVKGLGGGDSMVSIAAGRIYGMSTRGEDEFRLGALGEGRKGNLGG